MISGHGVMGGIVGICSDRVQSLTHFWLILNFDAVNDRKAARVNSNEVDAMRMPKEIRQIAHILGESLHRNRLWRITVDMKSVFTRGLSHVIHS